MSIPEEGEKSTRGFYSCRGEGGSLKGALDQVKVGLQSSRVTAVGSWGRTEDEEDESQEGQQFFKKKVKFQKIQRKL